MEEKLSFRCANCGETVEFQTLSNWRDAIRKDLDGRPRETEEFSLESTVHRCPKCGYVSFDVSKNIIKDKAILASNDYKEILNNKSLPESVNNFLALGFVYEKQEEFYHSSHAYLCASWVLEKLGKTNEKTAVLEKTAYCLLKYINSNSFKSHIDATAFTCAVDVLRRIGKFENAHKLTRFALTKISPEEDLEERQILIMELILCSEKNSDSQEIQICEFKTNLKDIFETVKNIDNESELNKRLFFSLTGEYVKKCILDEIADGVYVVVDKSKHSPLEESKLKIFADSINKSSKEKEPEHIQSRIINQSNFVERFGIKKEPNEEEPVANIDAESDKKADVQSDTVEKIDIVYLDDEFDEDYNDDVVETIETIEELARIEDEIEAVEEVVKVEETETIDETEDEVEETETLIEEETETIEETTKVEETEAEVEEIEEEADEVEETETLIEEETETIVETAEAEERDTIAETAETEEKIEEAPEVSESIILTLAKFDRKISIGEVQALFECSYTKAKDILDEIVRGGKLSWTTDEEVYNYSEK